MNDVKRDTEPMDALTAVGQQMLGEFEKCAGHIENGRAIVLVTIDGRGGIAMAGYGERDQVQAAHDLFVHLRAIMRAHGRDVLLLGPGEVPITPPPAATASRLLTQEERRMVVDALRSAAAETRRAKSKAIDDRLRAFDTKQQAHIDELARRAGTLDRLAAELGEHDLRLERLRS